VTHNSRVLTFDQAVPSGETVERVAPDFEPAWREMHEHLSWMQSNKALPARYLGWNLAAVANDLIDRAYPGLREGNPAALSASKPDDKSLAEAAMALARDEYRELYGAELKRLREAAVAVAVSARGLPRGREPGAGAKGSRQMADILKVSQEAREAAAPFFRTDWARDGAIRGHRDNDGRVQAFQRAMNQAAGERQEMCAKALCERADELRTKAGRRKAGWHEHDAEMVAAELDRQVSAIRGGM
jgi:hypothetical protein